MGQGSDFLKDACLPASLNPSYGALSSPFPSPVTVFVTQQQLAHRGGLSRLAGAEILPAELAA